MKATATVGCVQVPCVGLEVAPSTDSMQITVCFVAALVSLSIRVH